MKKILPALLLLLFTTPVQADIAIDDIAGVYQENGGTLRIVKYGDARAYFGITLSAGNGHSCDIQGEAVITGDTLAYTPPKWAKPCELTLKVSPADITMHDEKNLCRLGTCGAQASYDGVSFARSSQHKVDYANRPLTALTVDDIAGVYTKDEGDTLEIVKYADDLAYFRTKHTFHDGRVCDVAGIGRMKDGQISYDYGKVPETGEICQLTLDMTPLEMTLRESGEHPGTPEKPYDPKAPHCPNICAEGRIGIAWWDRLARRDIRDMDKILASEQYKEAVGEHDKRGK